MRLIEIRRRHARGATKAMPLLVHHQGFHLAEPAREIA
jgi:hypothetical protein